MPIGCSLGGFSGTPEPTISLPLFHYSHYSHYFTIPLFHYSTICTISTIRTIRTICRVEYCSTPSPAPGLKCNRMQNLAAELWRELLPTFAINKIIIIKHHEPNIFLPLFQLQFHHLEFCSASLDLVNILRYFWPIKKTF